MKGRTKVLLGMSLDNPEVCWKSSTVVSEDHLLKLGPSVKGTLRLDVSEIPCLSCASADMSEFMFSDQVK